MGLLSRAGGVLLLVAVAAAWASLLTWSRTDPSLTHAVAGTPSNMLGTPGAVFADVMLNTLGFASVFLLLAPMFWGYELAVSERISANRKKTSLFPLAVLLLAGGFAVLPVIESWPFAHSLGGIVGDWLYKLTATIFSVLGFGAMIPLAGLAYFLGGFAALGYSVGVERDDLHFLMEQSRRMARRRASLLPQWLEDNGWRSGFFLAKVAFSDEHTIGLEPAPGAPSRPRVRPSRAKLPRSPAKEAAFSPSSVSSSAPPAPCTTMARLVPSSSRIAATSSRRVGSATPIS